MPSYHADFIVWLAEQSATIDSMEAAALEVVHESKNAEEYRRIMQNKAELLASLSEQAQPYLQKLPQEVREPVAEELARFSYGAQKALSLNSVFYMSALLYPDNHTLGQPNNLQRLLATYQK